MTNKINPNFVNNFRSQNSSSSSSSSSSLIAYPTESSSSLFRPPVSVEGINIPANGNCLYTTIFFGYLMPFLNKPNEFFVCVNKLLGSQLEAESIRQFCTKNIFDINQLRIKSETKDPNCWIEKFKKHMGLQNSVWGGQSEIQTISNKLNIIIQEFLEESSQKALIKSTKTIPSGVRKEKESNPSLEVVCILCCDPNTQESVDRGADVALQIGLAQSAAEANSKQHFRLITGNPETIGISPLPSRLGQQGRHQPSFSTTSQQEKKITPEDVINTLKEYISNLDKKKPINESRLLIPNAMETIRDPSTKPKDRIEIAELLSQVGYLVHGNLDPVNKPFKPEKITYFEFERPFKQLRLALSKKIKTLKEDPQHKAIELMEKRNKLIANLAFNLTYIYMGQKMRAVIYLPIQVQDKEVYILNNDEGSHKEFLNKHSESALYHALLHTNVMDKIISAILPELENTTQKNEKDLTVYKINAVVLQMVSLFKNCDTCHENNYQKFIKGPLLKMLEDKFTHTYKFKIPSNSYRGLSTAVQFSFDFAPTASKSTNSYTFPLYFKENSSVHPTFQAHQTIIQRHTKKADTELSSKREYTLFLSNGGVKDQDYDRAQSQNKTQSQYKEAIRRNILPLSVEQENLTEALKEWEYTGFYQQLDEKDACKFCDHHGIIYEYQIQNKYNDNTLTTGSHCITKFTEIEILDENGSALIEEDARENKLKKDFKVYSDSKKIEENLKKADKNGSFPFFDTYKEKGFLTPSQALNFSRILLKLKVHDRLKILIKETENDKFKNLKRSNLMEIAKWMNKEQKISLNILPKSKKKSKRKLESSSSCSDKSSDNSSNLPLQPPLKRARLDTHALPFPPSCFTIMENTKKMIWSSEKNLNREGFIKNLNREEFIKNLNTIKKELHSFKEAQLKHFRGVLEGFNEKIPTTDEFDPLKLSISNLLFEIDKLNKFND